MDLPKLGPLAMDRVMYFLSPVYWSVSERDRDRFQSLMEEAMKLVQGGYYFGDNLFTWGRNNSLLEDDAFRKAWSTNSQNPADEAIGWRRYILACAAYHCVQLPGDFVECGVYAGTGIKTVMDYLGGASFPKTFWGYDTFDYHPVKEHQMEGQGPGFHQRVQERFAAYPQVRLVAGLLPFSFSQGVPERVAYLHIDLNNADGEIAVLERLFDRVVSGGIIILDDYEWAGVYRPQKRAEDPWFAQRGYRVFPLPTGQGLVLKR
jgi:O-methyltransferase